MIKNIFRFFVFIFFAIILFLPVRASESVTVHLFWSNGCPHCQKERAFLDQLKLKYSEVIIKSYEISENRKNSDLLTKVGKEMGVRVAGVPFTVVGSNYIVGYMNDETTGREIEKLVLLVREENHQDVVAGILDEKNINRDGHQVGEKLLVPVFGEIDVKNISLPVLTVIIALLDGFNPCAMWTLLFLISLLLGIKDKKRRWLLGIIFILTSGVVYYLFLAAWLNLFLFIGLVFWVRLLIGILAIGVGSYYLTDFIKNKSGGCKIVGDEKQKKIFEKIKQITERKQLIWALTGIMLLAIAVNMVELLCSAGLPAVYTQVLAMANLTVWQHYVYLLLYVLIFMFDDLVVFFVAMITLQSVGVQSKYARYSHLIGGLLMFLIGLLLIFRPEWLVFG